MKNHKFFVSTLIAAAAMTANVYADIVTSPTWESSISSSSGEVTFSTSINGGFNFDLGALAITDGESFTLSVFQSATSWANEYGTGVISTLDPYAVNNGNDQFRFYVGKTGTENEQITLNVNGWSYTSNVAKVESSDALGSVSNNAPAEPSVTNPLSVGFLFGYVNNADAGGNDYFVFSGVEGSDISFSISKEGGDKDYNCIKTFNFSHLQNTNSSVSLPENVSTDISLTKSVGISVVRGASVSIGDELIVTDGTAGNLVWAGTSNGNAWNYSSDNEIWSMDGGPTSFMKGDNVTFTSAADNKTVSLENGATLVVGDMAIESGEYVFTSDGSSSTISGKTLSISGGASMKFGGTGESANGKTVSLDFENISVSGTLNFNTQGAHSWSSLCLEEGGALRITDGAGDVTNLAIEKVSVNGTSSISFAWNKKVNIAVLSGAGNLTVTGTQNHWSSFLDLGKVNDFEGVVSFNNGNSGLIVNLTGETAVNSAAKLVFNNGVTVNNTGTLTLDGEIVLSGTINNTGTVSVNDSVKIDISQMTATDNVYTIVSGGTISDSWSSLTSSNFLQNGGDLGRGTFSNTGELGTITFAAEAAKALTWNGGASGTWDYNSSQSWKDSSDIAEKFYTNDSVIFDTDEANVAVMGVVAPKTMTVSANTMFTGTDYHISVYKLTLDSGKTLRIAGGTLELTGENQSDFEGTIDIGESGTLKLTAHDACQWSKNGTINLEGSAGKVAKLVIGDPKSLTMRKTLNLKGYAEIASENNGVFNSWEGLVISAEKKNNVISGRVQVRQKGLTLDVADNGELLVSGVIETNGANGDTSLTKSGKGILTLSGENTFTNVFNINTGVVVAASTSALGSGNVTVKADATLKIAVSGVSAGAVTLEEGAMLAIDLTGFASATSEGDKMMLNVLTSNSITFGSEQLTSQTMLNEDLSGYFDATSLGDYAKYAREWSYDGNSLSLTLTIPEPSAFGLLAGVGALALCVSRRRRVKKA